MTTKQPPPGPDADDLMGQTPQPATPTAPAETDEQAGLCTLFATALLGNPRVDQIG